MAMSLEANGAKKTIKRLLRRQNTQEYFKEDGWTQNAAEAKCFVDIVEVAETCVRCRLEGVELTLRVESHASDFFCTPVR